MNFKMKIELVEEVRKNHERKQDAHSRLLRELSTTLLPKLFLELGIENYRVIERFIEPGKNLGITTTTPDLVILYLSQSWNVLLVEAKTSIGSYSISRLEEQLNSFKGFVDSSGRANKSLYYILENRVPFRVLQACGIRIAGVYGTKKGSFKVIHSETLR